MEEEEFFQGSTTVNAKVDVLGEIFRMKPAQDEPGQFLGGDGGVMGGAGDSVEELDALDLLFLFILLHHSDTVANKIGQREDIVMVAQQG